MYGYERRDEVAYELKCEQRFGEGGVGAFGCDGIVLNYILGALGGLGGVLEVFCGCHGALIGVGSFER